jgi:hypothetical protein
MRKTTVYLSDEDADGLRRLAAATGQPQAELIRQAIARLLARTPRRKFRSLGMGRGPGGPTPSWDADDIHARSFRR